MYPLSCKVSFNVNAYTVSYYVCYIEDVLYTNLIFYYSVLLCSVCRTMDTSAYVGVGVMVGQWCH